MSNCNLCPRQCGADRENGKSGICGVSGKNMLAARAALHFWEEPCISGEKGSGTVFFSGCPLRCVYCQNYQIASTEVGMEISEERLKDIFLELQEKGAHNINLVTPTHYTPEIIRAIGKAKEQGLRLPVVYNCSGYEKVETLKTLKGIVDIYLTDFKYMEKETAVRYSKAPDYQEIARAALKEMMDQTGEAKFDENGIMQSGVIVRHLLLPGHVRNARAVVKYVYETYGNQLYLSLMNQYTPLPQVKKEFPELDRRVTEREYQRLISYALELGIENAFIQDGKTAEESFIPMFDYEGIRS